MPMSGSARVRFERPPVVEVVCGVLFDTRQPFRGTHIGLYTQLIRKDFPRIDEAPPVPPVIEARGTPSEMAQFGFGLLPPLRRTWCVSEDGRSLIQVQEDRFIFNWKKAAADDTYPTFDQVSAGFEQHLSQFRKFLADEGVGTPIYRQFELIYVNHIQLGSAAGFEVSQNRLLVDHVRDSSRARFLPDPETVNWTTIYALPNGEGRLYAAAQTARSPEGERILRLDMTARGMPSDGSEEARRKWFDQAHVWITHGFADATAADVQKHVWGRIV
jgi:uncharacterized protein (TIGR04255 family)